MSSTPEDEKQHVLHITVIQDSKALGNPKDRSALLLKPFDHGFKRELVVRATHESPSTRKAADAYYYRDGHKMRSKPEVVAYLNKHPDIPLKGDNFSFCKRSIHKPPHEVVRQAKPVVRPVVPDKRTSPELPKVTVIRTSSEPERISATRRPSCDDATSNGSEHSVAKKSKTLEATGNGTHVSEDLVCALVPEVTLTSLDISSESNEVDMEETGGDEKEECPSSVPSTPLSNSFPGGEPKKCEVMYDSLKIPASGPASCSSGTRHLVRTYSRTQPTVLQQGKMHKHSSVPRSRNGTVPVNAVQSRTGAALELCNLQCPLAKGRMPSLQCFQCLCLFHPVCVGAPPTNSATRKEESFICRACRSAPPSSEKQATKHTVQKPTVTLAKKATVPFSLPPCLQKPPCPNITVISPCSDEGAARAPVFQIRSSVTKTHASPDASTEVPETNAVAQLPDSPSLAPRLSGCSASITTTMAGSRQSGHSAPLPVIQVRAPTTDSAVAVLLSLVRELNEKSKVPLSTPRTFMVNSKLSDLTNSTGSRMVAVCTTVGQAQSCPQKSQTVCTNHGVGSGSVVSAALCPLPKPVVRVDLLKSPPKEGAKDPAPVRTSNRVATNGTYFPESTNGMRKERSQDASVRGPTRADEAAANSSDEERLAIDVGRRCRRSSSINSSVSGSASPNSFSLTDMTLSDLLADCDPSSMPNTIWSHDDTDTKTSSSTEAHHSGRSSPKPNVGAELSMEERTASWKLVYGLVKSRSDPNFKETVRSESANSGPPVTLQDISCIMAEGNVDMALSNGKPEHDLQATSTLRNLLKRSDIGARDDKRTTERSSDDLDASAPRASLPQSTNVPDLEVDTGKGKGGQGRDSVGPVKSVGSSSIWVQLSGNRTVRVRKEEEERDIVNVQSWTALRSKEECRAKKTCCVPSMEQFTSGYKVLDLVFRCLPIPTLCRAAQVCTAWNSLSKQMHLWEHVVLADVLVTDWGQCAAILERMWTRTLTAEGRMWRHLAEHMQRLHSIQRLRLRDVAPADLLLWANLFSWVTSLWATVVCNTTTTTAGVPTGVQQPAELRLEGFGCLGSLEELVLEGPAGLCLLRPVPLVSRPLGGLRRLGLRKVVERCPAESFLSFMKELEELEFGSCRLWTAKCFKAVSELSQLRRLTLIDGGCQEGLSDALIKLKRLERLQLKRWRFRENLNPALKQLPELKELQLALETSHGDAQSNLNALLSCLNLSALKRLSWTVSCQDVKGVPVTWWTDVRSMTQLPPLFLDTIRIPFRGKTCSCARGLRPSCCDIFRKVGRFVDGSTSPKEGIPLTELSDGLRQILSCTNIVIQVDLAT